MLMQALLRTSYPQLAKAEAACTLRVAARDGAHSDAVLAGSLALANPLADSRWPVARTARHEPDVHHVVRVNTALDAASAMLAAVHATIARCLALGVPRAARVNVANCFT